MKHFDYTRYPPWAPASFPSALDNSVPTFIPLSPPGDILPCTGLAVVLVAGFVVIGRAPQRLPPAPPSNGRQQGEPVEEPVEEPAEEPAALNRWGGWTEESGPC